MDSNGNGVETCSYSVLVYPAMALPEQYRNMIFSRWMRSLKYGNEYFKLINPDDFFDAYSKYIRSILERPRSTVRLAVLSDSHDVALGWSVVERDILHYVHVQHEQRNKGIARQLVPVQINVITHLTKSGSSIWQNKLPSAIFNPFAKEIS